MLEMLIEAEYKRLEVFRYYWKRYEITLAISSETKILRHTRVESGGISRNSGSPETRISYRVEEGGRGAIL